MTLAEEHPTSPLIPSRRSVVRAAAWSVPAISVAAAAPAFASTGEAPGPAVSFTSGMFWRPNQNEITDPDEWAAWRFLDEGSIIWITQVTNMGEAPESVSLELAAPPVGSGLFPAKGFRVLNASGGGSDVVTAPEASLLINNGTRSADGRVVVTLPAVPVTTPATVTVVIQRPESVTRGQSPSWNVTVTPPGEGSTRAVQITSYADFLASITP